jgi:hypothetical protein
MSRSIAHQFQLQGAVTIVMLCMASSFQSVGGNIDNEGRYHFMRTYIYKNTNQEALE